MKILNPTGNRGRPEDRNPLGISYSFASGSIAPHADTTRWTYTVPANRRFILNEAYAHLCRTALAGAAGAISVNILVNQGAGNIYVARLYDLNNYVGDTMQLVIPAGLVLLAGHYIYATTSDTSTGGTVLYTVTLTGFEYDA